MYARPCLFGPHCQGMSPHIPGHAECGGVVLAEAMTPAELEAFDTHGTHPPMRRACILCNRFVTMDAYMFTNKSRPMPSNVLLNWCGKGEGTCLPLEHSTTVHSAAECFLCR